MSRELFRSIEAGFYVFPLMANFGLAADVELWTVILSYFLGLQGLISVTMTMKITGRVFCPGILSLLSGSFLLIFEGLLSVHLVCMNATAEATQASADHFP